MGNQEILVEGTAVVSSSAKPKPYNPLHRPKMNYRKAVAAAVIYLMMLAAVVTVGGMLWPRGRLWLGLAWSAVYFGSIAKRTLIWLVHLYQSKAPDRVRLKCVFEPSCSEYMILAVNKYGLFRGFCKGIGRLLRCHPPNGGRDDP